jgi:hypothetical protein
MWLVSAMYRCHDCGKDYEGRNAMGLAALHHRKTGHHTSVQMVYAQHFPNQPHIEQEKQKP